MESTLLCVSTPSAQALCTISKALNRRFSPTLLPLQRRTRPPLACFASHAKPIAIPFASSFSPSFRGLREVSPLLRQHRFRSFPTSAASFGTAAGSGSSGGDVGGSGGDFGGGGSGGEGWSEGGDARPNLVAGGAEEVPALSPDVIILDVGGMTCGGCAASVKKILESRPQVSSASVNLTTETAIVWPVSEAKVVPNWQKQLGEELAKHLTSCGFTSNLRGQGAIEGDVSP